MSALLSFLMGGIVGWTIVRDKTHPLLRLFIACAYYFFGYVAGFNIGMVAAP